MCGIIGYRGARNPVPILFDGLRKLEYRGYDSWGIAVRDPSSGAFHRIRRVGKISAAMGELESALSSGDIGAGAGDAPSIRVGVGHTRWATHGGVTEVNTHPHTDSSGRLVVAHNGIVENFEELKASLAGHDFSSETDTEVIAHLVADEVSRNGGDLEEAFRLVFRRLEGRNAVVLLSQDSDRILVAKNGSPVVIGLGKGEHFIASDVPAFLEHTKKVLFLADGEMASIGDTVKVRSLESGKPLAMTPETIEWDACQAEKGAYPTFMLKEIMEQPEVLFRASNQPPEDMERAVDMLRSSERIFVVGCGTAGQVAHLASYLFSAVAGVQATPALGSEFEACRPFLSKKSLLIAVSQSGETADLLEAVKVAKASGGSVLSILNVRGSTLMRESDLTLLVHAGPEKAVASTKATLGQITVLLLLAHALAGRLPEGKELIGRASHALKALLSGKSEERLKALASKLKAKPNLYLIGRGINFPVAREGAIKIQEVSTLHAEGIAGGELKHYALALVEKGTPCIALASDRETRRAIIGNAMESKSRGGMIIRLSPENSEVFDEWLEVPDLGVASPLVTLAPLQLLAYHLSLERGFDPDYCRNLAKSVTVK